MPLASVSVFRGTGTNNIAKLLLTFAARSLANAGAGEGKKIRRRGGKGGEATGRFYNLLLAQHRDITQQRENMGDKNGEVSADTMVALAEAEATNYTLS